MKKGMFKIAMVLIWALLGMTSVYADSDGGIALYDPALVVINQSNQAYTLEWRGATMDTLNGALAFKVKNQGVAQIAPNSKHMVAAHFFTLTRDDKSPKRSHFFFIALYDRNHKRLAETRVIHNVAEQGCSILLDGVQVVIDKQGVMTLVFNSDTKGDLAPH